MSCKGFPHQRCSACSEECGELDILPGFEDNGVRVNDIPVQTADLSKATAATIEDLRRAFQGIGKEKVK